MNSVTFIFPRELAAQCSRRRLDHLKVKHNKDQQHLLLTQNTYLPAIAENGNWVLTDAWHAYVKILTCTCTPHPLSVIVHLFTLDEETKTRERKQTLYVTC